MRAHSRRAWPAAGAVVQLCWTRALCCLGLLVAVQPGLSQQTTPPGSMVVVLTNLSVLRGPITLTEKGVRIETSEGFTIDLAHNQIAAMAESLEETFPQVARRLDLSKDEPLSDLVQWCFQNGLEERANTLIEEARSGTRNPALLAHLEWMTSTHRKLQERPRSSVPPAGIATKPDLEHHDASAQPSLPSNLYSQVADAEIDRVLGALPKNAERFFNRELQPKLVAGCAAAACHHAERSGLALWHDGAGHVGIRGFSRRNLYQVLQWVDRDQPASSRLLEMARTGHGEPRSNPWAVEDPTYQLLEYWTYALSNDPSTYYSDVVLPSVAAQLQQTESTASPATESPAAEIATVGFDEIPSPLPPEKLVAEDRPDVERPLVPCDPLPFNRKYHPNGLRR